MGDESSVNNIRNSLHSMGDRAASAFGVSHDHGNQFNLEWEYVNGEARRLNITLPNGSEVRARLDDVTPEEARRATGSLTREFNSDRANVTPTAGNSNDVINGVHNRIERILRDSGVDAMIENVTVATENGRSFSTGGTSSMVIFADSLVSPRNVNGRALRVGVSGLSEPEANQVREYFMNQPDRGRQFIELYDSIARDGQVTSAEFSLVNNATEQLFVRAGVSADVTAVIALPLGPV